MNSAGLKDQLRSGVWAECAMAVTFLSNSYLSRTGQSALITLYLEVNQSCLIA
jgi:hypothetical protein